MNTEIGAQWRQGLPPYVRSLPSQFFATVDQEPCSVHYQDLVALSPTPAELEAAAEWVTTQDASDAFAVMLQEVIHHVIHDTGRGR